MLDSENIAQEKKNMDCENLEDERIHFVLVHGAMHGAWCWYKIVELLEKDGHKVSAIDLMCAGTNPVTADSIMSFEEYNQPLMHFLSKLPRTEKVKPNKDIVEQIEFNFGNGIGEPPTSALVPKKLQKDYFYGTTSTLDATLASLLLRPCPMTNLSVDTTDEGYGVVPRVYIKTTKDNALSLAKQEKLIANSLPEKVYSLDSDHCPFFSAPEKLHSLLLEIANTYCV